MENNVWLWYEIFERLKFVRVYKLNGQYALRMNYISPTKNVQKNS